MKKYIITLLFLFLFSQAAEARDVWVLLKDNALRCTIGGTSYVIRVASGAATPKITGSFSLSYAGGGLLKAGAVSYAMPVTVSSRSPIIVDGVSYHGSVLFEGSASGFSIVNRVDIEEYLNGVLKDEMSPAWPAEALKAQAVLARTYTISSKKHDKYDLCATVHCQSYGGVASESPSIIEAVKATAGEVLKYGSSAAQVFYYSDSGGFGASSKAVWGKEIPYLQARQDPISYKSPNERWQATLSMQQIASRLATAGLSAGTISSIRPYSRDESGRVRQLEINGKGGRKLITGNQFRLAVGAGVVKSTLFEFGVSGFQMTISGRGSGHGVGMPQWTAKALAEAGWSYRRILDYYFPGTTLESGN